MPKAVAIVVSVEIRENKLTSQNKKLIEVALPLDDINAESAREKSIRHGHPSTVHLWSARRPLAACRAVLFSQLVDDPSSLPDLYPTEETQIREREPLFDIIRELVKWDNVNNEQVLNAARLEIARSVARQLQAEGAAQGEALSFPVLIQKSPSPETVNEFLAKSAPPVLDPFAGGGSIPLEAQRLGLCAYASDLNPVAVLINKALIEIPPKFANRPPVNPEGRKKIQTWRGAKGLADDVRYYGECMRNEAHKRIGHLYGEDPNQLEREHGKVIAWLWARTVPSPDPAFRGAPVPLVSSYWLSKKPGKEAWLEPVVDKANAAWKFEIRKGKPSDSKIVDGGTKTGRGDFVCLLSGYPMTGDYLRSCGKAGQIGARMMALVREGKSGRIYEAATATEEALANVQIPESAPDTDLPEQALGFRVQNYRMRKHRHLFTPRQLVALTTLSDLVGEARKRVLEDAGEAGGGSLESGGTGSEAYADAVAVYLGMAVSKLSDALSSLCRWSPSMTQVVGTFGRHAIPMMWDFGESNVFSRVAGDIATTIGNMSRVLDGAPTNVAAGHSLQRSATAEEDSSLAYIFSTDPPDYDNVPYANLSDYFYVWLRRSLKNVLPQHFRTLLVPKSEELVADPFRHGDESQAEEFFLSGIRKALGRMAYGRYSSWRTTVYYAFKQSEEETDGIASTGWETFLEGVLGSGFMTIGTWPMRTERGNRVRGLASNALATSVVLVCRKRPDDAPTTTRAEFRRVLKRELPDALRQLQHGNIAPVDLAQAAIRPGMAIFSRHAMVMEDDGTPMSVRSSLQIINRAFDEYFSDQESELDGDTRFAVTWFSQHGLEAGAFGVADTLARSCNVSVQGIAESGILHSAAGKIRLYKRSELKADWNPATDARISVWEATQHLIKRLEESGEEAAASLIPPLAAHASRARALAYRLSVCERKGWSEEALAYNTLVVGWPELTKLAESKALQQVDESQRRLFR